MVNKVSPQQYQAINAAITPQVISCMKNAGFTYAEENLAGPINLEAPQIPLIPVDGDPRMPRVFMAATPDKKTVNNYTEDMLKALTSRAGGSEVPLGCYDKGLAELAGMQSDEYKKAAANRWNMLTTVRQLVDTNAEFLKLQAENKDCFQHNNAPIDSRYHSDSLGGLLIGMNGTHPAGESFDKCWNNPEFRKSLYTIWDTSFKTAATESPELFQAADDFKKRLLAGTA